MGMDGWMDGWMDSLTKKAHCSQKAELRAKVYN